MNEPFFIPNLIPRVQGEVEQLPLALRSPATLYRFPRWYYHGNDCWMTRYGDQLLVLTIWASDDAVDMEILEYRGRALLMLGFWHQDIPPGPRSRIETWDTAWRWKHYGPDLLRMGDLL